MPLPAPPEYVGDTLTDQQIAGWAKAAGIPDDKLGIAVAIALAENGSADISRVSAVNFDGSRDYGIWQINDHAHPEKFERWPQWWSQTNAQMMAAVSGNGQNWSPWTTYKTGAYLLFLPRGNAAAKNAQVPGTTAPTDDKYIWEEPIDAALQTANALKESAAILFKAGAWMANPNNWMRVAQVVVGGALLFGAANVLAKPITDPMKDAALSAASRGTVKGGGKAPAKPTPTKEGGQ